MNGTESSISQSEFQDAIQTLQALTNKHEKTYRLEIGRYILERFFGGSAALYGSHDTHKDSKFKDFTEAHSGDLAELDLAEHTLRRCVRVRICYDGLPPSTRDKVGWSATLQISSLEDPNQRARLAMAAATERWPVAKVKQAVALATQHRLWDAEAQTPGLQLPAPKDHSPPQPGRLVTQLVKTVEDLDAWRTDWASAKKDNLRNDQRERYKQAVAELKAKVAELDDELE